MSKKIGEVLIKVSADTTKFHSKMEEVSKRLVRQGRRMSIIGTEFTNAITLPLLAAGAAALKFGADLDKMERGLAATMGKTVPMARMEMDKLVEVAKTPGLGFTETVQASIGLQSMGKTAAEARFIIQNLGRAVDASGGSANEFALGMKQVQDILVRNKLTMEDWRRAQQAIPSLNQAAFDAYGTNDIEKIRQQAGSATEAIYKILEAAGKLEGTGGSLGNSLQNLHDAFIRVTGSIGKTIAEVFNLDDVATAFEEKAIETGKAVVEWIGSHRGLTKAIIKLQLYAALAGPILRLGGSFVVAASGLYKFIGGVAGSLVKVTKFGAKLAWAANNAKFIADMGRLGVGPLRALGSAAAASSLAIGGLATGILAAAAAWIYFDNKKSNAAMDENDKVAAKWAEDAKYDVDALSKSLVYWQQNMKDAQRLGNTDVWAQSSQNVEIYKKAIDIAAERSSEMADDTFDLNEALKNLGKTIDGTGEKVDKYRQRWEKIKKLRIPSLGLPHKMVGNKSKKNNLSYHDGPIGTNSRDDVLGAAQGIMERTMSFTPTWDTTSVPDVTGLEDYLKSLMGNINIPTPNIEETIFEKLRDMGEKVMEWYENDGGGEMFAAMNGAFDAMIENKKTKLENYYQRERQLILQSSKSEEQKAKALAKLDKKVAEEKKKIQKKEALRQKALAIFQASINAAQGITKAFADGGILGFVTGALVAAATAIQIAKIASAPLPALAKGGLAYGPTQAIVGDNPHASVDPEVIAPLSKLKGMLGGGGASRIHLSFDEPKWTGEGFTMAIKEAKLNDQLIGGIGF